ncbi:MAG TPA: NAD-dependent epimerase/dehydratase family protein [Rubricoccaceae bacterium]|jgi:nucleoside-diphosphate-sugar epimerase
MLDSSVPSVAFVTGGTGFVGSHLVEALVARGVGEVRCLVRSDPKWLGRVDGPVTLIQGDLFSQDALRAGLDGVSAVYHVAGLTRARDQAALDRANVDGTRSLLAAVREAAPDVRELVVTSSLEAMGPNRLAPDGAPVPATEADTPRPVSMYGRSKAGMERMVADEFGDLRPVLVRPPAVYGPREADIFEMIRAASRGVFAVVGDGRARRLSLVHVRDLTAGMILAAQTPGRPAAAGVETYFIGSHRGHSWDEVRAAMAAALGRTVWRLPVPTAAMGVAGRVSEWAGALRGTLPPLTRDKAEAARHAWVCSVAKAEARLGYRPTVGLAAGMAETVAWARREGWL